MKNSFYLSKRILLQHYFDNGISQLTNQNSDQSKFKLTLTNQNLNSLSMWRMYNLRHTTVFTYSHANTPLGQSERVYYLSYFIKLNNWVLESMDEGKVTGLLFVDISKAFDFLNPKVLLRKLEHLGLSERCLRWLRSYLADRQQSELINGELSEPHTITLGVPQGRISSSMCTLIACQMLLKRPG